MTTEAGKEKHDKPGINLNPYNISFDTKDVHELRADPRNPQSEVVAKIRYYQNFGQLGVAIYKASESNEAILADAPGQVDDLSDTDVARQISIAKLTIAKSPLEGYLEMGEHYLITPKDQTADINLRTIKTFAENVARVVTASQGKDIEDVKGTFRDANMNAVPQTLNSSFDGLGNPSEEVIVEKPIVPKPRGLY